MAVNKQGAPTVAAIRKEAGKGQSRSEIARTLGLSKQYVSRVVKDHGIAVRHFRNVDRSKRIKAIKKAAEDGCSGVEAAARVGMTSSALRHYVNQHCPTVEFRPTKGSPHRKTLRLLEKIEPLLRQGKSKTAIARQLKVQPSWVIYLANEHLSHVPAIDGRRVRNGGSDSASA